MPVGRAKILRLFSFQHCILKKIFFCRQWIELKSTKLHIVDSIIWMPKSTPSRRCRPKPTLTTFACFDELRKAIDILNADNPKPVRTYCNTGCLKKETKAIIDKQTMYYLSLLKQAVAKHRWKHVCQLLLEYIDQPKDDKIYIKHIFNVTLIYLLNDPISKKNETLNEFLQLAVSCQNDQDRSNLLKKIMMMPDNLK